MRMLDKIKERLGANYVEDTDTVLQDIINDITSIAVDASNRKLEDKKLIPYIKKSVISEYLQRGAEGLLSRNEGSVSSSFRNIEENLRKNLVQMRILK